MLPATGWLLDIVAHASVKAGDNCFKRFLKTHCLNIISVSRGYSDSSQMNGSDVFFICKNYHITLLYFVR